MFFNDDIYEIDKKQEDVQKIYEFLISKGKIIMNKL